MSQLSRIWRSVDEEEWNPDPTAPLCPVRCAVRVTECQTGVQTKLGRSTRVQPCPSPRVLASCQLSRTGNLLFSASSPTTRSPSIPTISPDSCSRRHPRRSHPPALRNAGKGRPWLKKLGKLAAHFCLFDINPDFFPMSLSCQAHPPPGRPRCAPARVKLPSCDCEPYPKLRSPDF